MKYGLTKITTQYGEDGEVSDINLVHNGSTFRSYKQFKVRHLIHGPQEATAVILRFSADMKEKRESGILASLKEDTSTEPMFVIRYPRSDTDGSYIVVTSWTEKA